MSKKNLITMVIMTLAFMGVSLPSFAQQSRRYLLNEGPDKKEITFPNDLMAVYPKDSPKPLIFTYKGGKFPYGTNTQIQPIRVDKKKIMYSVEYMIPGDPNWYPLTIDDIKCGNPGNDCKVEPENNPPPRQPDPEQSVVPDEPETPQCNWYYYWPCMTPAEKVVTGTVVTVGVGTAIVCALGGFGGGGGANNAGDGGGICSTKK